MPLLVEERVSSGPCLSLLVVTVEKSVDSVVIQYRIPMGVCTQFQWL